VIRDILGVGLGAKPILNTDVFAFAPKDLPARKIPRGVLPPRRIIRAWWPVCAITAIEWNSDMPMARFISTIGSWPSAGVLRTVGLIPKIRWRRK